MPKARKPKGSNMSKLLLTIMLVNAYASQSAYAASSSNVITPIKTVKEVCDVAKNKGHFDSSGSLVMQNDKYAATCGRANISTTGVLDRSILEIKAFGSEPKQWQEMTLTLSTDVPDIYANAAFRDALFKIVGSVATTVDAEAKAYNLAYSGDLFEVIQAGDYTRSVPGVDEQIINASLSHEYNVRGGNRVTLEMRYF